MNRKFRQTVAAFLAASTFGAAPMQEVRAENTTPVQQEASKSNKQAIVEDVDKKGQGVQINQMSGGLEFDFARMHAHTNPIYFPAKRKWAKQRRDAQARRKVNAKRRK